jgi:ABC-type polar amino acid transport system ATPase subunit
MGGSITVDGQSVHAKLTEINKLRRPDRVRVPAVQLYPHLTAVETSPWLPSTCLKVDKETGSGKGQRAHGAIRVG